MYESVKKNLRVGFEIEMNSDCPGANTEPEEVNGILEDIEATFGSSYGFVMALGKGGQEKYRSSRI